MSFGRMDLFARYCSQFSGPLSFFFSQTLIEQLFSLHVRWLESSCLGSLFLVVLIWGRPMSITLDLYLEVVSKLLISDRPKSITLDHCFVSYRIYLLQIFHRPNSWPPSASYLYGRQMVTNFPILPGRFAILYMGSLFLVFQCSKTASLRRPFWF